MKKKEKLMKIGFNTKTAYGDDVKSKKTKCPLQTYCDVYFFPYSLFLFFSSSEKFLHLSLACSLNLSLLFS